MYGFLFILLYLCVIYMCGCSKETSDLSDSAIDEKSNINSTKESKSYYDASAVDPTQKTANNIESAPTYDNSDNIKFSFSANTYFLIAGESETVLFYASIEPLDIVKDDITVYDGDDNAVGVMEKDNDGFFILSARLFSDTEKTVEYYAKFGNYKSEEIFLNFFKPYTASKSDTENQEKVCREVSDVIAEYNSANGRITLENFDGVISEISLCLNEYKKKSVIESYSIEGYTVSVKLPTGYTFLISVIPDGIG